MATTIKTKADLDRFVKGTKADGLNINQLAILGEIRVLAKGVKDENGRSTKARDAAKAGEVLRKKLASSMRDPKTVAPKKASAKKASKKAGKKAAKAAPKPRAKKTSKHSDEAAVSGKDLCLCGCGGETNFTELRDGTKRYKLFLQGHDARLKGKVMDVSRGLLPKSVLSVYAKQYISHWPSVSDEVRDAIGIPTLTLWPDTEMSRTPRSWEEFDGIRGDSE